jgi:hypothetical protein
MDRSGTEVDENGRGGAVGTLSGDRPGPAAGDARGVVGARAAATSAPAQAMAASILAAGLWIGPGGLSLVSIAVSLYSGQSLGAGSPLVMVFATAVLPTLAAVLLSVMALRRSTSRTPRWVAAAAGASLVLVAVFVLVMGMNLALALVGAASAPG